MSIGAYCRRPVHTATPDETLLAAAQRMEKEGTGVLVVTAEERLVGVLTDRDLALEVAAKGRAGASTRVGEAMSTTPVSVRDDAPLEEAFELMRGGRVRRLPLVVGAGRVAGLVSADDLVRHLSHEIGGLGDVLTAQLPAGAARFGDREASQEAPRPAAQHYGRDVVTAPAATSIAELARAMQEGAVGSVVLLDEAGRAVGLVTDRDVARRVVAAGRDPATTAGTSVMSAPLVTADPSDPLERVVARMREARVRRIPILRDGRPAGIVTFDDLLVAFGSELDQLGACVADEIRAARAHSQRVRLRRELEARIEEAAAQLRRQGASHGRSATSSRSCGGSRTSCAAIPI